MTTPRRPTDRVHFERYWAILLWGLAAAFVLFEILSAISKSHMDAPAIWTGLEHFVHGISPYGVSSHRLRVVSPEGVVTRLQFGYVDPPGSTLIDAPLGLLSLALAQKVIVIVAGVAAMVAIVAMTRGDEGLTLWGVALAALLVSFSRPFHHELSLGNLDLLALLPIALGLAALARGHERLGAILMALGVCVKPTAAAVLLAPLLAGRWRVTALALAAAVAVTLVGFAVVPHSTRFITAVIPYLTGPEQASTGTNGSLVGLVRYLEFGGLIPAAVIEAGALLAFVALALRYRRELSDSLQASVALCVLALLLVPSYSFEVYALYLVLALPFLLRARGPLELTLLALAVLFIVIPDVVALTGGVAFHYKELRPALGRVALAVLVVVMLERQHEAVRVQDRRIASASSSTLTDPAL
ncbi:MAG: glycosyltransferase family 87 protein [Solirubrobacteraceae bacterium]